MYTVFNKRRPALEREYHGLGEDEFRATVPCRFRYLTANERAVICNGCGGKGGWFRPPQYEFGDACDHHDFNYWLGYRERDRWRADKEFRKHMNQTLKQVDNWWYRQWLHGVAWRFWTAVKIFGRGYFNYSDQERGWDDLVRVMEEHGYGA